MFVGGDFDRTRIIQGKVSHELLVRLSEENLVLVPLFDVEQLMNNVKIQRSQVAVLEMISPDADISIFVSDPHIHVLQRNERNLQVPEDFICLFAEDTLYCINFLESLEIVCEWKELWRRRLTIYFDWKYRTPN